MIRKGLTLIGGAGPWTVMLAAVLSGFAWSVACAQSPPSQSVSFATLQRTVPQAADEGSVRELSVRPSGARAARTFALVSQKRMSGRIRRERDPRLSDDRLVLVVRDRDHHDLSWQIVLNPSIVRAEVPGADGRLSGQTLETANQDWSFVIPDLAAAASVVIYQPRWANGEYLLDPLAELTVP